MSPRGTTADTREVSKIINGSEVRSLIEGSSASNKAGLRVLSEVSIKERHGSVVSPQVCGKEIKPADEWKNTKTFMFGLLGSKSYERVYKVKEIDRRGGGLVQIEPETNVSGTNSPGEAPWNRPIRAYLGPSGGGQMEYRRSQSIAAQ